MCSFRGSYANRGNGTEQASSDVYNFYTKDAAIPRFREGGFCERNPGGVPFTYNDPAARTSLRSKLASATQKTVDLASATQKTVDFCRRFSVCLVFTLKMPQSYDFKRDRQT